MTETTTRSMKIYTPENLLDPVSHFRGAKTGVPVRCAFNLAELCMTDCAACAIKAFDIPNVKVGESYALVECLRMADEKIIGTLVKTNNSEPN
jgi:hypothetical protein